MTKRASVLDVAEKAGVSTATVSRVLNAPDRVAEPTRKKVLAAIDDLQFVKSATAFSFKVRQTHSIVVLAESIANFYFAEVFEGLHQKARATGYNITLATAGEAEGGAAHILDPLMGGRFDGAILLNQCDFTPDDYDRLKRFFRRTPPIVCFAEQRGVLAIPHVLIDNEAAALKATRYLIARGHRHIAHIGGPKTSLAANARLRGYQRAMTEAGLGDGAVMAGAFHRQHGHDAAQWLTAQNEHPTAVFCASDEIAMGLMAGLHEKGLKVPDDISVMGFDNIGLSEVFIPALTTIAQPMTQIGASCFELLLQLMAKKPLSEAERVIELDVELIERQSVRAVQVQ